MDHDFWHERWARGEIGFHQPAYNAYLTEFWPRLALAPGQQVLVPLCGKSLDMLWLLSEGYEVIGIELSEKAVRDFLAENQLTATEQPLSDGRIRFNCNGLTILCGDFFSFTAQDTGPIAAVYDRAALIAMPTGLRSRYVAHLLSLLPKPVPMLLVSMVYDQAVMDGPPFSVTADDVHNFYFNSYKINSVHRHDLMCEEPDRSRWLAKGLKLADEQIFLLTP